MLKSLLFIAAAGLLLSGCQTTTTNIDGAIARNLPQVCSAAATAHSAFVVVASTGNIKPATVRKETAAYSALQAVCAAPESVTAATALVRAAEAYAAITIALREAKGA